MIKLDQSNLFLFGGLSQNNDSLGNLNIWDLGIKFEIKDSKNT